MDDDYEEKNKGYKTVKGIDKLLMRIKSPSK